MTTKRRTFGASFKALAVDMPPDGTRFMPARYRRIFLDFSGNSENRGGRMLDKTSDLWIIEVVLRAAPCERGLEKSYRMP